MAGISEARQAGEGADNKAMNPPPMQPLTRAASARVIARPLNKTAGGGSPGNFYDFPIP